MRRDGWLKWIAGVLYGYGAFLVSRVALAGAAWLILDVFFGLRANLLTLVSLVGLRGTPLLLAFVPHATPFFGPGVLRVLYGIR